MIVIGELINATRKKVREAVINHDEEVIKNRAAAQAEAGADYIDVNVGTGKGETKEEIENMKWAVNAVQQVTDKPISVDSPDNEVIRAGLEVCAQGKKHFVNSVTAAISTSVEPSSLTRTMRKWVKESPPTILLEASTLAVKRRTNEPDTEEP